MSTVDELRSLVLSLPDEAAALRSPGSIEVMERKPIGVRADIARCDAGLLADLVHICWSHVKG
ncbi:hypothetical protein OHA25_33610 [Nonomuraea sp. NBC_00507]|uniref:hypothetical protein n=1 Tax=Nonomuraea sp. NBC_00507 TaxID=2976002 RepID=UPI002E19AB9B